MIPLPSKTCHCFNYLKDFPSSACRQCSLGQQMHTLSSFLSIEDNRLVENAANIPGVTMPLVSTMVSTNNLRDIFVKWPS